MSEKIIKRFNEEQATPEQISKLRIRNAVRIIIMDDEYNIALINVKKGNYYSLPGGGVEADESTEDAAIRESKEEVGCDIKIFEKVGLTEEVRLEDSTVLVTHCYIAKIRGKKGLAQLSQEEIDNQFEVVWADAKKALELLKSYDRNVKLYFKYFHQREIILLEEALNYMHKI